jgi:hypothetical protein
LCDQLVIEMAFIMDPRIGPNGVLDWDPKRIPPTKPFVHIITSPAGPLVTQDEMNFIKTKSLIYTAFHSNARNINFEIGYPTDAKWFDFLKDKWPEYANFFIGGFLEAIYTINENTYIQIDAKSIDYDARFRSSSTSYDQSTLSSPKSQNAFAQRRAQLSSPITPKSIRSSTDSASTQDVLSDDNLDDRRKLSKHKTVEENDDDEIKKFIDFYKRFKDDREKCPIPQTSKSPTNVAPRKEVEKQYFDLTIDEPADDEPANVPESVDETIIRNKKRQLSDLCDEDSESNESDLIEEQVDVKRGNKKRKVRSVNEPTINLCDEENSESNEPDLIEEQVDAKRGNKKRGRGGKVRGRGGRKKKV